MITLIDWVDNVDLRTVKRTVPYLKEAMRKHGLRADGDAVVFVNTAVNRFRMIVMQGRVPMLVLPPVADRYRQLLSIFVLVTEFLRSDNARVTYLTRKTVGKGFDSLSDSLQRRRG